jgi:uncharacterized protein YdhG (YjbR/CyaY superfamily)
MNTDQTAPKTIDEYIVGFPADVQETLQKIMTRQAAPDAKETIKYQMPTFTLKGNLIYFAAYKKHISIYPLPDGSESFNRKLSAYRAEKSTVRFPIGKPIPFDIIEERVTLRVQDNLSRAEAKEKKK